MQHIFRFALLRMAGAMPLEHENLVHLWRMTDIYMLLVRLCYFLQDVLLETVAGPVRLYLQGRKDTVRCIVGSLTDENSGDLYEELRRQVRRNQSP